MGRTELDATSSDLALLGVLDSDGLEVGSPRLAYLNDRGEPLAISLAGEHWTCIGRAGDCKVRLRDPRVSRHHAKIESVSGQFLLNDAGSANGTTLNGHRIAKNTALVLREGDEITIGETRILFGRHADVLTGSPALDRAAESSYPIEDLLTASPADEDAQPEFLRAFSRGSKADGLARSLAIIAEKLQVHAVAIFTPQGGQGIELAAAFPDADSASRLGDVAHPIMASARGRIVRPDLHELAHESETTREVGMRSSAAVSLSHGKRPIGVLAVERRHGLCLEREDLARLARLGERLATTLALQDSNENDTRLGVDD